MEDNEKQYLKGFNNGYLIAQHQPDLFEKLDKGLKNSNDYTQGFLSGGKEYEKGKNVVRLEDIRNKKEQFKETIKKVKDIEKDR